ncbi:hypothetical protein Tco_1538323 [Tanacetum coccineum]
MGTIRFGNDQIEKIMVYGYYQLGSVTISQVYYVEGLGHKLFSVGQFCDTDLEVAFRKHTCHIRDLKGVDLLIKLTAMASKQFSLGPRPQLMTLGTLSSGLMPNPHSSTPYVPPIKNDWDILFQPMFDELLNPPPSIVSLVPTIAAQRPADPTSSPMSTSVDQVSPSSRSSSNVWPSHTPLDLLGKWTKNHPLENVIGDPSRSVSTRKQLKTDAMWCYFDAFLISIEPENFKEEMLESSWIEAMQEEIHEFERLQVWELVPYLDFVMLIKLKWIYKVKKDELGGILNNKARLVAIRGTVCTCCQNRGHSYLH